MEVIAGQDEFDGTISKNQVPAYTSLLVSEKKYKIAYIAETLSSKGLQPEIKETLQSKINELKKNGHQVDAIDFPLLDYVLPTYYILATAEASSNLSRYDGVRFGYRSDNTTDLESMYKKSRSEGFGKEVQNRILLGTFVLSASYYDAYYTKAQKVRRLIREKTKAIFSDYDFILTPTTPTTAFRLGEHRENPVEMYLADLFSVQANVAGIPAISLPGGNDKEGMPIGIQVMADDFEESKLFDFSNQLIKLN
jgi:aspartyl-tRNA(Asn)/glutamyl-tRNA(Gln) amidotransferase subunit A